MQDKATAPTVRVPEFAVDAYATEARKPEGLALRTVEVVGTDGQVVKQKAYVMTKNVPAKVGVVVNMISPAFRPSYGGWDPLLECIDPASIFAVKLREALAKQAAHVAVWDADLGRVVALPAEEAHKLGVFGKANRVRL